MNINDQNNLMMAVTFANQIHRNQMYGNLPYIAHCMGVHMLLESDDPELGVASILHDTIEDGDDPDGIAANILSMFGNNVLNYVRDVTRSKSTEYAIYINSLVGKRSAPIKVADLRYHLWFIDSHRHDTLYQSLRPRYVKAFFTLTGTNYDDRR
jgi:(p)ppGpp synthase/HD superfamily hydrolase